MLIVLSKKVKIKISQEHLFMISALFVNGGNYLYNLLLGRILGPEMFADAAIMITFLLVLSFIAMTFQLVTAKFAIVFEGDAFNTFISNVYKSACFTGIIFGALIVIFSPELQAFFKTKTSNMFVVFGIGVPFYFMMSINRGVFQGKKLFNSLAITYQSEMISRLLITLGLLYILNIESSIIIALGILCSFVFGLFPYKLKNISFFKSVSLDDSQKKLVRNFFIITAFYELTQIIINNSDILLVKHYFEAYEAGLYASLALIGRVVYFIAWMFVMMLLPTVVQLKKEGKSTHTVLLKYVGYISVISAAIIFACFLFPTAIIQILFGGDYLSVTPLLWKYALATGIFALSNIFAYYYLSLEKYIPVVLSGIFGMLQIVLVVLFHKDLAQVVHVQIIAMFLLLFVQLFFFFLENRKGFLNQQNI
ncbi:oligosaccharide flippase family protein [Tenacibaculum aiptasiae]|uniref:Oligosaccharide flippase family protein n=1 Tax=Tenacibaculum aiptasiae TaxID=426481 RepID=A0A7J5AM89_9FLAO|nr:oligosaccharide flippase family protein [Tenacibaculum aiptasiae]KAB1158578.1 oligosaccharide flippase family protein [Tenacibaculum aiptasiae]